MSFAVWQCQNEQCRLRFPAEASGNQEWGTCPRCRAQMVFVQFYNQADVAKPVISNQPFPLSALLDNIRSIHNTGSIFRTADGAGLAHLYLCGITATPEHPRLAKAALGAHLTVAWSHHANAWETAVALKETGHALWGIETMPGAIPLFSKLPTRTRPTVMIVGNEKAGVDPGLLPHCDHIFSLPMSGGKHSLNAAVAFGIVAYTLQFSQT